MTLNLTNTLILPYYKFIYLYKCFYLQPMIQTSLVFNNCFQLIVKKCARLYQVNFMLINTILITIGGTKITSLGYQLIAVTQYHNNITPMNFLSYTASFLLYLHSLYIATFKFNIESIYIRLQYIRCSATYYSTVVLWATN